MDLPSMVQRSGNTLIVRSVVSGNQLYVEQQANAANAATLSTNNNNESNNNNNSKNNNTASQIEATPKTNTTQLIQTQDTNKMQQQLQQLSNGNNKISNNNNNNNELIYGNNNTNNNNTSANMSNNNNNNSSSNNNNSATTAATAAAVLERLRAAALAQQQLLAHGGNNDATATAKADGNNQQTHTTLESKDEGLPQCKIKRNYSCSYCPYFTQNPRSHLMHLRDVHGEKIVINKCKLCLYASRHFQKLVRHMKMVHGCTDGIPGGNGQARGKRGMSRDVRRRRLEESVGIMSGGNGGSGNNVNITANMMNTLNEMPTYEQLKRELQLQEQKLQLELYNDQQQKNMTNASPAESFIVAAYGRQFLQQAQQLRQSPASNTNSEQFQQPPAAHQQNQHIAPPSTTPSPSGSGSASPPTIDALYNNNNNNQAAINANNSIGPEQMQNRLLKCSVCEYTTLFADKLMEHERQEHCKTKFFRCEKCSYVTHIKARFSKHVKYHSMPMIKCVTCDFRTPYKWNLDRHMKNHGGAGPFKCAACDFTADIKQSLTVHEMNHHVPPVGHAAGMSLTRRRNKVGGTDLPDEFLSDSAELMDDQYNNNMDEYEEALLSASDAYGKRKYDQDDEPTDLSQKGNGSASDTSSVHNQPIGASTPKRSNAVGNLMQLPKLDASALNLSRDLASRSSLNDIASMFFNEKQLSELWTLGKQQQEQNQANQAAQLSPTATITSSASSTHNARNALHKQKAQDASSSGSLFEKLKASALTNGGLNGNLICQCGHMAKCLSESILHRKACTFATIGDDDELDECDEEPDDADDGRLEIDCADDEDKQSHSALNLSVSGSTRCQHCRHRCKSSADLLQHLKHCAEAMGSNESYDSMSGESNAMGSAIDWPNEQQHPMENRVFIWNKLSKSSESNQSGGPMSGGQHMAGNAGGSLLMNGNNEEYSYCGVETAPGYGEVTKKLTPEEEATSSSLKKVFKCPHCSFWASTASRFHVHIVGHLNKKPFECSLCAYRSNWRWDITKHIRLKTIRDPSHKNARVLMNDETGRRNYTKYNKYITLMKVTEEDGDPKLMKSGEMTPHQEASLAFINDRNKNSSGGASAGATLSSAHIAQQLSGMNNITLEPLLPMAGNKLNALDAVPNQFNENDLIRLPLFATIVNAALAEQQQQQKLQDQQATMITPSVTISAVKRSSPPLAKPSDDLITEIRQEGNEKKTCYRCRKCSFRHNNRDAVLAHVKIHYQDPNYPIVTATLTSSSSNKPNQQQQAQQLNATPFMNKVLAAMCLSQQSPNSTQQQQQQQQHSIPITAELLQQAMQNGNSNTFNSLALALAGKLPQQSTINKETTATTTNAATSILEHGEQNASQNEASAQLMTSPTATNLAHSLQGDTSNTPTILTTNTTTSLQDLLTSPRGTYTNRSMVAGKTATATVTPTTTKTLGDGFNANNNNKNLVMVGLGGNGNSGNHQCASTEATAAAAAASNTNTNNNNNSNSNNNDVTTHTSTHSASTCHGRNLNKTGAGEKNLYNVGAHDRSYSASTAHKSTSNAPTITNTTATTTCTSTNPASAAANNLLTCITTTYKQNNSKTNKTIRNPISPVSSNNSESSSCSNFANSNSSASSTTLSSNLLLSLASSGISSNATAATSTNGHTSTPAGDSAHAERAADDTVNHDRSEHLCHNLSSQLQSALHYSNNSNNKNKLNNLLINNNSNHHNNGNSNSNNNGNNSGHLLTHECNDRRDPSPYRCGHCHQVSNWKHVIQRHCRLKHAGDIRIETIDRAATNEQHTAVYRALGNGATNETNYNTSNNNNNNGISKACQPLNNNNNVLNFNNKGDSIIKPQDLQAAAAYIQAVYKAATANANPDDILIQQQLQQNDQIEITRLPSSANANLAQLLEQSNNNNNNNTQQQQQQNTKSKQQKCPLCPYISESKSQMNYHISLHKPTQYQCQLCTFVCAKKQHLSNHMRNQHQQHLGANNASAMAGLANGSFASLNLDIGMAIQLAAAVQAQQNMAPLAIDLTALQNLQTLPSNLQPILQQQQTEEAVRTILYCHKCPARFVQQPASDPNKAKADLDAHLQAHNYNNTELPFQCDFCDFRALHETQIQAHYYVHTQHYQHKFNELYQNCMEHEVHRSPKLVQMTLARTMGRGVPDAVWVVDQELLPHKDSPTQDTSATNATAVSSTTFDTGNSLLKKQLEAGPAAVNTRTPSPPAGKAIETDESADVSKSLPTTSGPIALSDISAIEPPAAAVALEKCLYCPFETKQVELYKAHLKQHICISKKKEAYTCDHCDYTDADKHEIEEHTRVHFNAMDRLKDVSFFTTYDKLELSIQQPSEADVEVQQEEQKANENEQVEEGSDETSAAATNNAELVIKRENSETPPPAHNNNNEDDAVNENTRQQEQLEETTNANELEEATEGECKKKRKSTDTTDNTELQLKRACNKIILYNNDGFLSVKKNLTISESENDEPRQQQRQNEDHTTSQDAPTEVVADACNDNDEENNDAAANVNNNAKGNITDRLRRRISNNLLDEQRAKQQQQQASHKTILVNAKTGQVINKK